MFEKAFYTSHLGEQLRLAGYGFYLQANIGFFVPIGRSTKSSSHYILGRRKPYEPAFLGSAPYISNS